MHGDITRETFRPRRHYWGVLRQQGRVDLDADWNEQVRLARHQVVSRTVDLIGPDGGPADGNGFRLTVADGAVTVGAGRYYVGGILCENDADVPLAAQPDPPGEALPAAIGIYLSYLDVWDRHVTALDDPYLRETALGGPDTATRARTIWQVKNRLLAGPSPQLSEALAALAAARAGGSRDAVEAAVSAVTALVHTAVCDHPLEPSGGALAVGTGTMAARTNLGSEVATDPCRFQPGGGFRLQENRLYRVEIHAPGDAAAATFKWSRDNGSVVVGVEEYLVQPAATTTDRLRVRRLGFDDLTSLHQNDWVEVIGDDDELAGRPGVMALVTNQPDPADRVVVLGTPVTPKALGLHPKLRRWDMPVDVGIAGVSQAWTELEAGIEVRFAPGAYHTGDHWLIPARANTGEIEWPPYPSYPGQAPAGPPASVRPAGIDHRRAPLAALVHDGSHVVLSVDERRLFPAATEHRVMSYAGGDGQEPELPGGLLPQPLQVAVAAGERPVAGAMVEFTVVYGEGSLSTAWQDFAPSITVRTDHDGLASVLWTVDPTQPNHRVRALLLGTCSGWTHVPVFFNARSNYQLHYLSGDGQEGMPGEPVQLLRAWVSDGRWPVVGAKVVFTVISGTSALGPAAALQRLEVPTDTDGVVECMWTLGAATPPHRVQAQLIDANGDAVHKAALVFNATVSLAERVVYHPSNDCLSLSGATTVAQALDLLCARGPCTYEIDEGTDAVTVFAAFQDAPARDAAICFGKGSFETHQPLKLTGKGHVRVSGIGRGTRIEAHGGESALRFEGCESVVVRDLYADAMDVEESGNGLNGVLDFNNCGPVSVEHATIRRGAAPEPSACGIHVHGDDGSNPVGPTDIRRCDIEVGEKQVGILVVNSVRTHIEANHVHAAPAPNNVHDAKEVATAFLSNRRYRAAVRRRLVSFADSPSAAYPGAPGGLSTAVTLDFDDVRIPFLSEIARADIWHGAIKPRDLATPRRTKAALVAVADAALRNKGPLPGVPEFDEWFDGLAERFSPAGWRGIVVAGTVAEEVRVLHNTVSGMEQGVTVALSASDQTSYMAGNVLVSGNSITTPIEIATAWVSVGIAVCQCTSLVVDDNFVMVPAGEDSRPGQKRPTTYGVRIGGRFGSRLVVRSNHFENTTIGAYVRPRPIDDRRRRWVASDNVATTGRMLVAPCTVMEAANVPARLVMCTGDWPV